MDPYSSGEKFNIKTRKPYTITKQRERWTEDEHNSFLEALKLYGRAWQRIEEHIGTKTAVQIRSHAQKFFTKLEKEALAKGVPIRQALDMEIPPPRPKRKPNYPYPRKTGSKSHPEKDGKQATQVSPLQSGIQILDLERKPIPEPEITSLEEKLGDAKPNEELENGTQGTLLSQEAPCVSLSSENENSIPRSIEHINPSVFRDFIPTSEVIVNHDETNESFVTTIETNNHQKPNQNHTNITSEFASSHENIIEGQNSDSQPGNFGNDTRCVQNYPRHVPVQVVDGIKESFQESTLNNNNNNNNSGEVHDLPNLVVNIAAASANTAHCNNGSTSSNYQTVPTFHPLFTTQFCDIQENYRSLLHVSSNISSLIVSSLLQNPAAHAAASFAATFWHRANAEASSGDSSARDHSSVNLNSETPSMAAIAAATVAAATAWWAAHGLLPVCPPFYACTTSPFSYGTPVDENQVRDVNGNGSEKARSEGVVMHAESMDVEKTTPQDIPKEQLASESADLSSSEEDSDERDDVKSNTDLSPADDIKEMTPVVEAHDSSKTNNVRKQVDRSSCGSNTTSSSEIETDALEKHGKEKEETKGITDVNLLPCTDSSSRRSRSTISPNESWKEVSEEGRLAFQALFSREVLPQSFSKDPQNTIKNSEAQGVSQLDLNRMTCSSQEPMESNAFALLRSEKNVEEGLLTMGLGGGMKLNVHHTGFKPYKRCSVEAKESKIVSASTGGSQNDEKGPKRMRLEAEAST